MTILQICRTIVRFPSLSCPSCLLREPLMRAAAHIFRPLLVGKLREKFLGEVGGFFQETPNVSPHLRISAASRHAKFPETSCFFRQKWV